MKTVTLKDLKEHLLRTWAEPIDRELKRRGWRPDHRRGREDGTGSEEEKQA